MPSGCPCGSAQLVLPVVHPSRAGALTDRLSRAFGRSPSVITLHTSAPYLCCCVAQADLNRITAGQGADLGQHGRQRKIRFRREPVLPGALPDGPRQHKSRRAMLPMITMHFRWSAPLYDMMIMRQQDQPTTEAVVFARLRQPLRSVSDPQATGAPVGPCWPVLVINGPSGRCWGLTRAIQ